MKNVYRIPQGALHDNSKIWVAGISDKLEIRHVEVAWRGLDTVFIGKGVDPGDRLIVSDISTPLDGMPLKVDFSKVKSQSISPSTGESTD
jgi:hypothetical protein